MAFLVVFKPLAEAEVAEAFAWYQQPHFKMGDAFLAIWSAPAIFWQATHTCTPKLKVTCDAPI